MDQIITTRQNILVVNTDGEQNYKFATKLVSRLDTTKYDPTITLVTDNTHAELFKNLGFTVETTPYYRNQHEMNDKSLSGKKKIILIDFNQHYKNDPDALRYISGFSENIYQIVLFSPLPPGHGPSAEKLLELMGNDTLYIDNDVVYCPTPKYIPDPRFIEKKSSWW